MIQAVILAGGVGSRMGGACKALIEVEGQPFIARLAKTLSLSNVNGLLLLTHEWPLRAPDFPHIDDGGQRLGTGGAVLHALPRLQDPCMILNGDSYVPGFDYGLLKRTWLDYEGSRAGLMVVFPAGPDTDRANTQVLGTQVQEYSKEHHKEYMHHVDAGIIVSTPAALSQYSEGADTPFDLGLIYRRMITANQLAAYETKTVPYEIGSPAGLERYRAAVREGRA